MFNSTLAPALILTACAAALPAQSQLSTINPFLANNAGSPGGGIYFDLTASAAILVSQLDLNLNSAASTSGSIDLYTTPTTYVGNEANAAAWTLVGSASVTAGGRDAISTAVFSTLAQIPAGTNGIAICTTSLAHAYTNGTGTNQVYSDAVLTLNAGAATNVCFAGSPFTPRVWNGTIYYTPAVGLYPGFTQDVTTGPAPLTVNFSDTSFSSDPSGIVAWLWDFENDGTPDSSLQNPTHTYTSCGIYDVSLTAIDATHGPVTIVKQALIDVPGCPYTTYANGCVGSAGSVTTLVAGSGPRINNPFTVTLDNLPTNVAIMVFGINNRTFNGAPLPLSLAQFGMPGCDGHVAPETTSLVVGTAGRGTWTLPIPNNPSFVGTSFYTQALVVDPGFNTLGAVMSNAAGGVVGQ